jgi:hypothetical protein
LAVAPNVGLLLSATALAIVAPKVAALGYLPIAIVALFRARPDEPASEEASRPPSGTTSV